MRYLKRKIDAFLSEWKSSTDRKPLLIKGARQVGKTASIMHFAKASYENVIYINFIEEPRYKFICADGYAVDDIVKNISRMDTGKKFVTGKTLLFFDEIQDYPDIATSLKFFQQDGRFDVICSGSLLGIHYKTINSNSVGYKVDYEMTSMDFEEFLEANGYDDETVTDMLRHMEQDVPFSQAELNAYNALFIDYCILGGMPAVVREYIERGTFENTLAMQRQLITDYKEDIRKYAVGLDQARIINVFNRIPVQLAQDNKKFQITKVAKGARFKDYYGCIEWLHDAGLINVCHCLRFPELPLGGNYDENKYKIYFKDTGLLVAMLDEESQEDLRTNKNLGTYKGALYENMVADALAKCGYSLYYYRRDDSTLEEDFFLRTKKSLVPVEVKAASGRAKSLKTLVESDRYPDIVCGIKLTMGNIGCEENIHTFPHFCTFLLKRYLATADF